MDSGKGHKIIKKFVQKIKKSLILTGNTDIIQMDDAVGF